VISFNHLQIVSLYSAPRPRWRPTSHRMTATRPVAQKSPKRANFINLFPSRGSAATSKQFRAERCLRAKIDSSRDGARAGNDRSTDRHFAPRPPPAINARDKRRNCKRGGGGRSRISRRNDLLLGPNYRLASRLRSCPE